MEAWWRQRRGMSRREVLRIHLPWVFLSGLAWGVSFVVPYQTPIRLCGFLRWTGYPCMFCGLTRSMSAFSQGAWAFAVHNAPVAILLYLGMVGVFVWHMTGLVTGTVLRPGYALRRIPAKWFLIILTAFMLANWAYRLRLSLT